MEANDDAACERDGARQYAWVMTQDTWNWHTWL
jgi:hypothetical protein